jgi:hypothetical protein
MMEAVRTSETSVDNHFTRQYNPEDSSEQVSSGVYANKQAKRENSVLKLISKRSTSDLCSIRVNKIHL